MSSGDDRAVDGLEESVRLFEVRWEA